jgi:hypothetical protein
MQGRRLSANQNRDILEHIIRVILSDQTAQVTMEPWLYVAQQDSRASRSSHCALRTHCASCIAVAPLRHSLAGHAGMRRGGKTFRRLPSLAENIPGFRVGEGLFYRHFTWLDHFRPAQLVQVLVRDKERTTRIPSTVQPREIPADITGIMRCHSRPKTLMVRIPVFAEVLLSPWCVDGLNLR